MTIVTKTGLLIESLGMFMAKIFQKQEQSIMFNHLRGTHNAFVLQTITAH